MPRRISQLTFLCKGFHNKRNFQCAFDDNLSATHGFIKQISMAAGLVFHKIMKISCQKL
jgi:hypothetical protein